MNSYIALSQEVIPSRIFCNPKRLSVFVYLLLNANEKAQKIGKEKIKRGSLTTTNETISDFCGITIQNARTVLAYLETIGEIKRERRNRYQIITIVNYEKYKDDI